MSFFSYKLKRFLHVALKKEAFKNLTPTPQKIKERKKPCTEENDRVGREESLHKLENYNIYQPSQWVYHTDLIVEKRVKRKPSFTKKIEEEGEIQKNYVGKKDCEQSAKVKLQKQ